jgi:indolepyruvate ferredoxin oxidoreductase alpha subunit
MSVLLDAEAGSRHLVMGNDAISRGALEAGVSVVAGYPGTPSTEIIEGLSKVSGERNIYVEWSVNEKVALEVAAAASFAGLRGMAVMKQVGVNVAADFLLHLTLRGTRGGLVLVSCEDPGGLSSTNEGESRHYARMMEFPLLEPGDFQEAKDMTRWAFELSEEVRNLVMVRSVTRLSHASGMITLGELPRVERRARFSCRGPLLDPLDGPVANLPGTVDPLHRRQQENNRKAEALFEKSPFNTYTGPERPELLVITSSTCQLYCHEAIRMLGAERRVGVLKLGTTWPLPSRLIEQHLARADQVLMVEEMHPFIEENIEALAARIAGRIGTKRFFGKYDTTFPTLGELSPDLVMEALGRILGLALPAVDEDYVRRAEEIAQTGAPVRALTFCPGCPHRASFWSIHNALELDRREGFVSGDIGCYSLAALPCGFESLKTLHAMGSGTGTASGFAKLGRFGFDQPIFSVCGDSTFFHAVMPALVNAIHNDANITMVVLDNRGTAMTGFQAHPGLETSASGEAASAVDIPAVCEAMGAKVRICDPFDLEDTQKNLLEVLDDPKGVKVVVLRQICALSPEKKGKRNFDVGVNPEICLGEQCGCNRLCTRIFSCPGLIWDEGEKRAKIDEVICAGCGVCASICPSGAIVKRPAQPATG